MNKNVAEKSLMIVVSHIKEKASHNLLSAVGSGQLKIDKNVLATIISFVGQSIDQGAQDATKSFLKELEASEKKEASMVVPNSKKK